MKGGIATHKYFVFDLDGTLAPIGKSASKETAELLLRLERAGKTVVLCSGKPTFYLCGFARQLGLSNPILIGENGASLQFGIDLPPKKYCHYPFDRSKSENIGRIRHMIDNVCGDEVWYQPNEVVLTPFFRSENAKKQIKKVIENNRRLLCGINVYEQCDCFDILPDEISKKNGISFLSSLLTAENKEFIAFGDGINDLPMFEFADISVGIGRKKWDKTDYCFVNIEQAIEYIITQEEKE